MAEITEVAAPKSSGRGDPLPVAVEYDPAAVFAETFRSFANAALAARSSPEKILTGDLGGPVEVFGHLSEGEFRRFARATVAKHNAMALQLEADAEFARAKNIRSGVFQEAADRFGLGPLKTMRPVDTPYVCIRTGAVYRRLYEESVAATPAVEVAK